MAEIRASYRRTFQVRPYETDTVELSVADEVPDGITNKADLVGRLHAQLAEVGDAVGLDRMVRAPQQRPDERTSSSGLNDRTGDPWAANP